VCEVDNIDIQRVRQPRADSYGTLARPSIYVNVVQSAGKIFRVEILVGAPEMTGVAKLA